MAEDYSFISAQNNYQPQNLLQGLKQWQDLSIGKQSLENAKLTNRTGEQALAQKQHLETARDMFALSNLPADQLVGAAQQNINDRLSKGLIDQRQHAVLSQGVAGFANNPEGLREKIKQTFGLTLSALEQLGEVGVSKHQIETGQGIQGFTQAGRLAPNPGELKPVGGIIPTGAPSNASLAEREEIVDNNPDSPTYGQKIKVSKGSITDPAFMRPGPPGAMRPPTVGGGGVATSLPPGVDTSISETRQKSTAAGNTLVATDAARPQTQALLSEILTAANNPKAFSGKDAPAYMDLMQRLQQIPGVVTKDVLEGTSAMESMAKAMANLQTLLMAGMIQTNSGLEHIIHATPHMTLSKNGLQAIVHQLQGNVAAQEVMSNAWQQSGKLPHEFHAWQRQFIAPSKDGQFDPRVFWYDKMTRDERQVFFRDVPDKERFDKNYRYAKKNEWVQ